MNKLVVLTDTGTFKAFRLEEDAVSSTPRLKPVEAYESVLGDHRISRRLSDQEGQRSKGSVGFAAINDAASGERHNIWLENKRRSVKEIAGKISELLADGEFESCYLAASKEINHLILDHLSPVARGKIEKNVACDLVNARREVILEHFKH